MQDGIPVVKRILVRDSQENQLFTNNKAIVDKNEPIAAGSLDNYDAGWDSEDFSSMLAQVGQ